LRGHPLYDAFEHGGTVCSALIQSPLGL